MFKKEFEDVFEDPKELPPERGVFDHQITLKEGSKLINIRPYRYLLKHRDIIEQFIQEMLERGIIQHSNSPYTSPVVLIV